MVDHRRHRGCVVLLAALAVSTTIFAGDVKHVAQEDRVGRFRTTTVPRANDPDGDGAYGSAGYVFYAVDPTPRVHESVFTEADPLSFETREFRTLSALPKGLALRSNGQAWAVGGFDYPLIDDPGVAPGARVRQVESGLALNNFVEIGMEVPVLDIVIRPGFPPRGFRIGVMAMGSGEDAANSMRLTQTAGRGNGSASAALAGTPEIYLQFFDLTGAAAGDRYTLYLSKGPDGVNPNVAYLGLTFDKLGEPAAVQPGAPRPGVKEARALVEALEARVRAAQEDLAKARELLDAVERKKDNSDESPPRA